MQLEDILKLWEVDSVIDEINLDETSVKGASLHSKYLELYSIAKLNLKKKELSMAHLRKDKWLYYNGKMDENALKSKGWEPDPFGGLKILKGEMDHYYDSDPEIQRSEEKIAYLKTVIETLNEIVNNLNWRHQTIGNMIRWKQFEAGS